MHIPYDPPVLTSRHTSVYLLYEKDYYFLCQLTIHYRLGEPDLGKWPPLRKKFNFISTTEQNLLIYFLYYLVLLPCTDSNLIRLLQNFYSSTYFEWDFSKLGWYWVNEYSDLGYGHPWCVCVCGRWGGGEVLRGFSSTNLSLVSIFCWSNPSSVNFYAIPVSYMYHKMCMFIWTHLTYIFFYFLPWMHWVERK